MRWSIGKSAAVFSCPIASNSCRNLRYVRYHLRLLANGKDLRAIPHIALNLPRRQIFRIVSVSESASAARLRPRCARADTSRTYGPPPWTHPARSSSLHARALQRPSRLRLCLHAPPSLCPICISTNPWLHRLGALSRSFLDERGCFFPPAHGSPHSAATYPRSEQNVPPSQILFVRPAVSHR
jgi:hypothetical protein